MVADLTAWNTPGDGYQIAVIKLDLRRPAKKGAIGPGLDEVRYKADDTRAEVKPSARALPGGELRRRPPRDRGPC